MICNDTALEETLLNKNVVCVFGEIDDALSSYVSSKLIQIYLKFEERYVPYEDRTVTLLINSPGGKISSGLAIVDSMLALNCKVKTICLGQASSMGAILLACGTEGSRYAFPNSDIMIHQPLSGASGQATDILIHADHVLTLKTRLNQLLADRTGQTVEKITLDCERDFYLTSKQAIEYGLIDREIFSLKELLGDEIYHE